MECTRHMMAIPISLGAINQFSHGDCTPGRCCPTRSCYPVNTSNDQESYKKHSELAGMEPGAIFDGRLGTYAYYDMHQVIDSALTAWCTKISRPV